MSVLPLSGFGYSWFVQRRLAYAVESRCSYGARDAVGINLGARNSDYNRDGHNDIYSWAYLELSQQRLGRRSGIC